MTGRCRRCPCPVRTDGLITVSPVSGPHSESSGISRSEAVRRAVLRYDIVPTRSSFSLPERATYVCTVSNAGTVGLTGISFMLPGSEVLYHLDLLVSGQSVPFSGSGSHAPGVYHLEAEHFSCESAVPGMTVEVQSNGADVLILPGS